MPTELLYRIIDEPRPGVLSAWVVKPFWPWLAMMLAGVWIGVPWFIVNAVAMGSPTRTKEIILSVACPVLSLATFLGLMAVATALRVPASGYRYLVLPLIVVKMGIGYVLVTMQGRGFELHELFGLPTRNGAMLAVLAYFVGQPLLASLPTLLKVSLM